MQVAGPLALKRTTIMRASCAAEIVQLVSSRHVEIAQTPMEDVFVEDAMMKANVCI